MGEDRRTEYQVRRHASTHGESSSPEPLLAWGTDDVTGQPRYILEFTREQTGEACRCHCEVCGTPLLAVNAGKTVYRRRPHFRHKAGVEHDACLIGAGRAALLAALTEVGHLTLPGHRRDARVTGLSGRLYEAWREVAPEPVNIADTTIVDKACAIVRLDDGREFQVLLVGAKSDQVGGGAAIEIVVNDPVLAMLSPEELRSRMRLHIGNGNWCAYWSDDQLATDAERAAMDLAIDAIDFGAANRETALHRAAKEILAEARCIMVPALRLAGGGPIRPIASLELEDVVLEHAVGDIRPDVVARTVSRQHWPADDLLVEVTVSNRIDGEREARIRRRNLPTLEIDLSILAGRLSMVAFRDLVVDEVVGKRWIHHPALEEAENVRRREQAARQDAVRRAQQQRPPVESAAVPEPHVAGTVRRARVSAGSSQKSKPEAPASDDRLGSPPFLRVPDLTVLLRSVPGMPSPFRQVIRSSCVLEVWDIQLAPSSTEGSPALRMETFQAPRWPASTLVAELATTGRPDPERLARVRERGLATLVVDVRGIDLGVLDEAAMTSLVFGVGATTRWAFHPAIDEYVRRFEAAQQSRPVGSAAVTSGRRD